MQDTANQRITWVDMAKGVGIYLVLLGHMLPDGDYLKIAIYSFHIPLFFFLSGYIYNVEASFAKTLKTKFECIFLPYLFFLVFSVLYGFILGQKTTLTQIFFFKGQTVWNDPIWFCVVIFAVECVVSLIFQIRGVPLIWLSSILCVASLVVVACIYPNDIPDYFGFQKILLGCFFFTIGVLCQKRIKIPCNRNIICAIATTGGYLLLGFLQPDNLSFYQMELGSYWIYIARAIMGIAFCCGICALLPPLRQLIFWGKHSFFIMCTQYIILTYWWSFSHKFLENTGYSTVIAIPVSLVIIWLYIPLCDLADEIFPLLNGKKKMKIREWR